MNTTHRTKTPVMTELKINLIKNQPKDNVATFGRNGLKRILMGLVLAVTMVGLQNNASAINQLVVVFKTDMLNTGVDQDANGKVFGQLNRSGSTSIQQLKLALANLDPNTDYQLLAFMGDETTPRSIAGFTTDAKGAFGITYVQRAPGVLVRGWQPLPNAVDPISRIHQLDIVKAGVVVLTTVIVSDIQADSIAPTVSFTDPTNAAPDVAVNQAIAATFSEPMNPATITRTSFTLKRGVQLVSGNVTYAGSTATFTPTSALSPGTVYTGTITTRVKDLAGNVMATNFVWSFTTGQASDANAPIVSSSTPADSDFNVPVSQTIAATFSEVMNPSTITKTTFTLTGPGTTPVSGTVAYNVTSQIATFAPDSALALNTSYTATITTGARDLSGNAMVNNTSWSFTTANTTATGQAPVALGSAASYAVLAGSTVTSTGGTTVNGDLGVSAGTAVTGFPPGFVNGTQHAGDSAAAQAQLDLTIAYNDAAGRTVGAVTVAGNLGGRTLTPGLYKSTSSLQISSGDLTLDAQGDANAVFIFQMESTLTTTAGRQVILSGGAKAANVYWQVGTSATLGTTSVFKGTIMADQSISLTTGATLGGRALTRIAAVTMESNIITIPTP
jgi:hypothetical protein